MIGRIAGIILHRGRDHVLIDVRGVGYVVHVSEGTAAGLPPAGQAVALYTDLLVREDLLQLFGFPSMLDREWHRLLTGVQGVGARVSLAVLGALGSEGLARAIALGDWAAVRKAQGVGPKLAQRIVLELKDKAPAVMALGATLSVDAGPPAAMPDSPAEPPAPAAGAAAPASGPMLAARAVSDALSALTNLGYAGSEAAQAVAEAQAREPAASTPALIRAALRLLAPSQ